MYNLVIGICDDDESFRKKLYGYMQKYEEDRCVTYEINQYSSAESLLEANKKFDILFLDIKLNGMSGMELASKIREDDKEVLFIFITSYIQYAPEGYLVSAFRYLIKPVTYEKFVSEVIAAENVLKKYKKVVLELNDSIYMNGDDIYYIECSRNDLYFYFKDEKIKKRGTIKETLEKLNKKFCQVHRSYIINLFKIKELKKTNLILSNGAKVPVSRSYINQFKEQYLEVWKDSL